MRIAVFSTQRFERAALEQANAAHGATLGLHECSLTPATAVLARGSDAACCFVSDDLGAASLAALQAAGIRHVALRSAGYNHVDLPAADAAGIVVSHVPAYSPHAVAEHATALILTLDRGTHRAYHRVREGNFALDGLVGFDLRGKTVGIVGTGRIGSVFAGIMLGFGCRVLGCDPVVDAALVARGVRYLPIDTLCREADVIALHCPLTADTHHLIDAARIAAMKPGVMLINTGRGALVDTPALIAALKSGQIGHLGLDVYEHEGPLFFRDHSLEILRDDLLARLLTFPNVLVTGHQGFLTREALANIAATTLANIAAVLRTGQPLHPVPR
jgi:D-lactate dehydrogenase